MIDPKVLKLERNYLTNCESKFKGTSNQDVPFFFCMSQFALNLTSVLSQSITIVYFFLKVSHLIGQIEPSCAVIAVGAFEVMKVLLWTARAPTSKFLF